MLLFHSSVQLTVVRLHRCHWHPEGIVPAPSLCPIQQHTLDDSPVLAQTRVLTPNHTKASTSQTFILRFSAVSSCVVNISTSNSRLKVSDSLSCYMPGKLLTCNYPIKHNGLNESLSV